MYNMVVLVFVLLAFFPTLTSGFLEVLDVPQDVEWDPFEYRESKFQDGPYALLVPASGCIEDEFQGWGPGYILFGPLVKSSGALLTKNAPNWPSFVDNKSFLLSFCTKLQRNSDSGIVEWPMGHYGVFKAGADCPPGFVERSNHFQLPEFQTLESEGELPDIDLFPDTFSMKVTTCMKEQLSDGTNSPPYTNAVYLLKDPEFECPMFDGYEVTEERLALECVPETNCVTFSLCHVTPNRAIAPLYDLDEWNYLGAVASAARCLEALGMADGTITNEQLSASSYRLLFMKPKHARPNWFGWLPSNSRNKREYEYFQIDLRTVMMIEGIEVQYAEFPSGGAANLTSDIKSMHESSMFRIKYAIAYRNFRLYHDKMLVVGKRYEVYVLVVKPFAARFVRIEIKRSTSNDLDYLRFELIGCKHGVTPDFHGWTESVLSAMCFDKLGLMDGTIFDFQITGSSWKSDYEPNLARPGLAGWCANQHEPNPYIQVDLIFLTNVQGLIIYDMSSVVKSVQTFCDAYPGVIEYTNIFVSFAEELPVFKPYKAKLMDRTIQTNDHTIGFGEDVSSFKVSTMTTTELLFLKRFLARSVRVEIIKDDEKMPACLRFEIIGCRFEGSMSITCTKNVKSAWIDDPIILPDREPEQKAAVLNMTTLENCQEFCQNELEEICSAVQFSNDNTCTIYPRGDRHRSKVISPESNVDMWRTRVCFEASVTEHISITSLKINETYKSQPYDLISYGYPLYYTSAIEQAWTVDVSTRYLYALEILFTNISLYPPTTDECEDKITIDGTVNEDHYLILTHEYNGAILFAPCQTPTIHIKLVACPRTYVSDQQRHYGFRAIIDEYEQFSAVWPHTSLWNWANSHGLLLQTFNLLGHPSHTLTKDVWKILVSASCIADIMYFNIPCYKGHQLSFVSDNIRHGYCGKSRPSWTFSGGMVTIEYVYGEPVFAAGFSATIRNTPNTNGLRGYIWPGQDQDCTYDSLPCKRSFGSDTLYCLSLNKMCDGNRDCTYNNEDESDYGCHQFLISVCSEEANRCYFMKEVIGEQGYWTKRNYTTGCSDLDGRYTLPIIHNKQQMTSLRRFIEHECFMNVAAGCFEAVYLDIGLRRYITDDGIDELWEDGTKVSFTAWRGQRTPSLLCTSLVFDNIAIDEYYWVYRPCEQSLTSAVVLCEQTYKQKKQGIIISSSGTSESHTLPFSSYECVSGEVIHMAAVCDGIADCSDGSDETGCETFSGGDCTSEEFACRNATCIGLHQVCDYKQDCYPEGDDELCDFPDCGANEFTCQNKQCIPGYYRCDAVKDCIDGTDEILCESCNETVSFPCEDLTCIHRAFVCDGINTCKYGRDEMNCGSTFSTCFEGWQAGYRNGTYLLDDVLSAQCTFTEKKDLTINVLTEMDLDVFVVEEGFKFNITSIRPYVKMTPELNYQAEDALCQMKIEVGCTPNIQKMKEYEEIGLEDIYNLCGEQTIDVRFNWSRDIVIIENDSKGISSVYKDSNEYTEDKRVIGCEDGTVAPMSTRCIYDIGRAGNPIGCVSFVHLDDCGDFECPSADYVKCPGHFCIPERFVCDGIKHCPDGADEFECGCGERDDQVTIVYSGDASEVKRSYIYKFGRLFLASGSDVRVVSLDIGERNVRLKSRTIHHSNEVMNVNKWQTHVIPLTRVTDFFFVSHILPHNVIAIYDDAILDDIDIRNSQTSILEQSQTQLYSIHIRSNMRLSATKSEEVNGTDIFVKTWDILGSVGPSLIAKCQGINADRCIGKFKCMSSTICIPLHQVCDGITQCIFGDDERLCDFHCPENCICGNYIIDCSAKTFNTTFLHTLPKSVRSLDLSYSSGIFHNNNVSFLYSLSVLLRLDISSCSITDIAVNAFEKTKNLLNLDISNNNLKYITSVMFKGLTKLRSLIMTGNSKLESLESHAFQDLLNIKYLKIVNTRLFEIVPGTFAGLRLSTLDISNNMMRKIHDMAFSGLDVETLKIDRNDISEFSRDIFTDMRNVRTIISPAFKFCCYRPDYVEAKNCLPAEDEFSSCEDLMRNSGLQTLLWVVGVSALVGNCLSIVYRLTADKVRLKLGYGIFVTNLAISDFLMGVYLLIIAVADLVFRNRYIEVEAEWRTSNYCKLAGVLATVSSEASVVFMCLITLDRILVIKFPFGNIRFRTKSAAVFSVCGWVLAWGIALFPLLNSKSFDGQFYSKSGVCLALPLTRDRAPGWLYSVLIFVGLNLVTFILIAVGQIIIYLEIKKHTKRMKKMAPTKQSTSRRNDMVVARNLFLVLTTDFLCWFPIGVMAIRALGGYPISGDVYAWTAVTVLPINAALNPILYTVTAILRRKQFNPRPEEQSPRTVDQKSLKRLLLSRYIFKYSSEDMTSVATLLSNEQWTPRTGTSLLLARSIVKTLCKLHECNIIHGELNADNVFVTSTSRSEVFMNVKPKACNADAEKRKDMNDFGHLLYRIMH